MNVTHTPPLPSSTAHASSEAGRPTRRPSTSSQRNRRIRWAIVAAFTTLFAAVRAAHPQERDPYWGARAGLENLAGQPLVRPDAWSWSQPGGVWYQNSPAWNDLLGLVWSLGGFWGLFLSTFVTIVSLLAVTWLLAVRLGARPLPGLAGVTLAVLVAFPMLNARATTVVQVLLLVAVWFGSTVGPKLATRPVWFGSLIVGVTGFAISLLGNWVHLSFVMMAVAVGLMWAIQWFTTAGPGWSWRLGLTVASGIGLLGGVLLSPYGVAETLRQSGRTRQICEGLIAEWSSAWDAGPLWVVRALVTLAVAAVASIWAWRAWRTGRVDDRFRVVAPIVTVALPSALAGLLMIRFMGVSALMLGPVFAALATVIANRAQSRARLATTGFWAASRTKEYTSGAFWQRVASLALIPLLLFGAYITSSGARPPEQTMIDRLPAGCRLFSAADHSGPSILTRPDVLVWMDGRADYFGRDRIIESYRIMFGSEPVPAGTSCVILGEQDPLSLGAVARLDSDPSWRRAGEAGGYVMWLPR